MWPNFAAGARRFTVQVQVRARNRKNLGAIWRFTNEIQHGGKAIDFRGAKGQIQNCPQMIFELAGYRAFDRPVAGIVDAGRHFVGHEATLIFEKLHGQNAGIVELGQNAASNIFRFALKTGASDGAGAMESRKMPP